MDVATSRQILRDARSIAVLGMKPDSRSERAAFYIPEYLASVGYELIPVPTRYPDATVILGRAVVRDLAGVRADVVSVFVKPEEQPPLLPALAVVDAPVIWFQSGFMHREVAAALEVAGKVVVHACIGCRRAEITPALEPLDGQISGAPDR
mgnify:FL=1